MRPASGVNVVTFEENYCIIEPRTYIILCIGHEEKSCSIQHLTYNQTQLLYQQLNPGHVVKTKNPFC